MTSMTLNKKKVFYASCILRRTFLQSKRKNGGQTRVHLIRSLLIKYESYKPFKTTIKIQSDKLPPICELYIFILYVRLSSKMSPNFTTNVCIIQTHAKVISRLSWSSPTNIELSYCTYSITNF